MLGLALAGHDPVLPIVRAAVEWAARHGSPLRISSGHVTQGEPVPLFRNAGLPGRADEIFLAHGFLKPPTTPSGKSAAPNVRRGFRLRTPLFGSSVAPAPGRTLSSRPPRGLASCW